MSTSQRVREEVERVRDGLSRICLRLQLARRSPVIVGAHDPAPCAQNATAQNTTAQNTTEAIRIRRMTAEINCALEQIFRAERYLALKEVEEAGADAALDQRRRELLLCQKRGEILAKRQRAEHLREESRRMSLELDEWFESRTSTSMAGPRRGRDVASSALATKRARFGDRYGE
ncbi:MAG: hypothetical protein IT290_09400 [Deltaproteobacteria bacterium]|nr:hypothetical protein [Deltaproteobacteria bacterium]